MQLLICSHVFVQDPVGSTQDLGALPWPWCRTPAPSGLVDGRPPIVSLPTALCFVFLISPSFASSLSPCLSAKLHDCLFLFTNISRARLFACLFINLHTFRTRDPFGGIPPGARPSALDRCGPRSLWSSAFVAATPLLDHSGTRVL